MHTSLIIKLQLWIYNLFLFLTISGLLSVNAFAFFTKEDDKPKVDQVDITSNALNGKKMRFFSNSISSPDGIIGVAEGSVFGFFGDGVFGAKYAKFDKSSGYMGLYDDVKIRTNQDMILYANKAEYSQKTKLTNITGVHIFFADNSSALLENLKQISDDKYEFYDMTFSACHIAGVGDVALERERCGADYEQNQAIFNPNNLKTVTNTSYADVEKQYNSLPWSIKSEKVLVDREANYATLYNTRIRLLGLPVLKITEFKRKMSSEAESGFLPPKIVFLGKRQVGLGIPYYTRISHNSDLIIQPTFYQDLSGINGAKISQGSTMDQRRIRENTLDFKYRNLFYDEKPDRQHGLLKLNTSITDRTFLIDPSTRRYKTDENGDFVPGHRWHIDAKLKLGINKDTYIKGRFLKASDPNYMAIYYMKFQFYARNFLNITKVNKDMYHMAEVMRFDPMLIYSSSSISPVGMPHAVSVFEQKIGDLPGRFLLSQRYANLTRDAGYTTQLYNAEMGYTLPIKTKSWNYFNFFGSHRFDHQNSKYLGFSDPSSPFVKINNAFITTDQLTNTSARMGYYGYLNDTGESYNMNRNYYTLNADFSSPIFTGIGRFGQFVFEPRLKYHQSPNANKGGIILEDSLATQLQRANLFANSLTSGYSVVDSGKRLSYGMDMYTRLPWYNINIAAGVGVMNYIGSNNAMYKDYNGFSGNFSDYVGNFKMYNNDFTFFHEYRLATDTRFGEIGAMADIIAPTYQVTGVSFTDFKGFTGGINYSTSNAITYGRTGEMKTLSPTMSFKFDSGLSIGAMGIRVIEDTVESPVDQWIRKGLFVMKQTNCMFYGVTYMENNYAIAGISNSPVMRLNVGFTGI